jgi:hypothetical protein
MALRPLWDEIRAETCSESVRSSSQGPAPCDGDGYLLRGTEEYRPRIRSHGPGEARHDCYDVSWRTEYRMCGCVQRVRDESCCTEHARGAHRAGCLWGCGCGRLPGRLKTRLRDVAASHFRIETSYCSGHASFVLAPSVRPRPRHPRLCSLLFLTFLVKKGFSKVTFHIWIILQLCQIFLHLLTCMIWSVNQATMRLPNPFVHHPRPDLLVRTVVPSTGDGLKLFWSESWTRWCAAHNCSSRCG